MAQPQSTHKKADTGVTLLSGNRIKVFVAAASPGLEKDFFARMGRTETESPARYYIQGVTENGRAGYFLFIMWI